MTSTITLTLTIIDPPEGMTDLDVRVECLAADAEVGAVAIEAGLRNRLVSLGLLPDHLENGGGEP